MDLSIITRARRKLLTQERKLRRLLFPQRVIRLWWLYIGKWFKGVGF